jgi:hypothetical protein
VIPLIGGLVFLGAIYMVVTINIWTSGNQEEEYYVGYNLDGRLDFLHNHCAFSCGEWHLETWTNGTVLILGSPIEICIRAKYIGTDMPTAPEVQIKLRLQAVSGNMACQAIQRVQLHPRIIEGSEYFATIVEEGFPIKGDGRVVEIGGDYCMEIGIRLGEGEWCGCTGNRIRIIDRSKSTRSDYRR